MFCDIEPKCTLTLQTGCSETSCGSSSTTSHLVSGSGERACKQRCYSSNNHSAVHLHSSSTYCSWDKHQVHKQTMKSKHMKVLQLLPVTVNEPRPYPYSTEASECIDYQWLHGICSPLLLAAIFQWSGSGCSVGYRRRRLNVRSSAG